MSDTIQVAIRVRPLSDQELNSGYQNIVKKTSNEPQILVGGARNGACLFTFNHVFSETDNQETVYKNSVQHMIKKLFDGYNVTILAYGQTGSGKTHTMDTNYNGEPSESMGIIPRAVLEIFENVSNLEVEHDINIKCSFVELYNEHLFDLLSNAANRDDCIVDIREDATKGIIIPGLTEINVKSIQEIITCLVKGSGGRAVGATAMNATSSRSHAIFTVTIEVSKKDNPKIKTCSRFHLVDLAGSERSKKTKATGNRLKEGIKINQGLFALGKCITALGGANSSSFVPYRESKLTRLLQDSLGGNSVTLLIACVSPADSNMDETLNTLNYANRAKNIKNKPVINHDRDAVELENWEKKAQTLRLEILNLENMSCLPLDNDGNISIVEMESISLLKNELKEAQRQNQDLQTQLRKAMSSLLNEEMKDDLIQKTYNDLIEFVNKIYNTISNILEKQMSESCHHTLSYMQKIQIIICEMKALLRSIFDGVQKPNENEDGQECNGTKEDNEDEPNLIDENDSSDNNNLIGDDDMNVERFHKKQLGFTNEIQQITKQIAIKQDLQKQILGNLPSFIDDDKNLNDKINDLENKIKTLNAERIDLESQLLMADKTNIASSKVADERQHKIQTLQQQILGLGRQHRQQRRLLALRDEDALRIKQLETEIQGLKASRIQITRQMRKCAAQHKKWLVTKNMEINKIRGLERKKKCEMSRMSISNKQRQNVLKRRIAETFAGIKNLESKIEKKRTAQLSRRRGNKGNSNCLKSEIDVILAITETETNLEHIKQNREHMISVIESLKQEKPLQLQEIAASEKELKQLSKQITKYHQIIIAAKKDDKIRKLIDEIGSIEEEKEVVKCLFGDILYLNKESSEKNIDCKMIQKSKERLSNKISLLEAKKSNINQKFVSDLNFIERRNEEKIGQLLREMQFCSQEPNSGNTTNRDKLMEETHKNKMEYLKIQSDLENENEALLQELNHLQEQSEKAAHLTIYDEEDDGDVEVDMFHDIIDDDIHDPDWKLEEEIVPRNRSHNNNSNSNNSTEILRKRKVSSELLKCGCTKSCSSKMCKCRKNDTKCNDKCKCNKLCSNVSVKEEQNYDDDSGENKNTLNISNEIEDPAYITDESTPKKFKLSANPMDVTTPIYPYSQKDRVPFYNDVK